VSPPDTSGWREREKKHITKSNLLKREDFILGEEAIFQLIISKTLYIATTHVCH
jgi:hypothetical protein